MLKDRFVQLSALLVAVASAVVAGGLLPGLLAQAGQEFLVVAPTDIEGRPAVDEEDSRVFTSLIRSIETLETVAEEPDLEVRYDAGTKTWNGGIGDLVSIDWRDTDGLKQVVGRIEGSDGHGLRYTDISVEGAPPIVALGTAIGALRGIIVDYLWLKVNMMKEEGQFYEVMSDAELITKLQPRFAQVWGFHGHNMAYNISVLTNTPEERWDWVKAGVDLVRNQGLRYNPNDVVLH